MPRKNIARKKAKMFYQIISPAGAPGQPGGAVLQYRLSEYGDPVLPSGLKIALEKSGLVPILFGSGRIERRARFPKPAAPAAAPNDVPASDRTEPAPDAGFFLSPA